MREIKFRAWDKLNEVMLYPYGKPLTWYVGSVWLKMCSPYKTHSCLDILPRESAMIFLQYTGLKDRNGKEIYEGDIIAGKYGKPLAVSVDDFHGYRFMLGIGTLVRADALNGEVIGNIYENPELLEKEGRRHEP